MKNTSNMSNRNIVLKALTLSWVIVAAHFLSTNSCAQTYTWDQQALGQQYQHCPLLNPQYWPSNSAWSQSLVFSPNCDNTTNVVSQPSNWTPSPPPGVYPGGPGAVGVDVVLGSPANTDIEGATATVNYLTIQTNGALYVGYFGEVMATTIDIQGDTIIGAGSYAGELAVANGGSLTKSGGTGTVSFGKDGFGNAVNLKAVNASLVVQSGTFAMPYNGGGGWLGGTFCVSNNATVLLDVDSGGDPSLCDIITGVGGGTVLMSAPVRTYGYDFDGNSHNGLTLNFPGKMFQWSGGFFDGVATNIGTLNITNNPTMNNYFNNDGFVLLTDTSSLSVNQGFFYNQTDGTVDFQGDANLAGSSVFVNYGLLKKSAGLDVSQVYPQLHNYSGTIEADSGTLVLNSGGSGGYFTNTLFVVSNGAVVSLLSSNNTVEVEGTLTGSGGGTVLMNNGTVFSYDQATLNFPGSMFQWQGGNLGGSYVYLTNIGTINISGPVSMIGQEIANNGNMIQSGTGAIGGGSGYLANNTNAIYQIQNDNGVAVNYFYNYGLLEKTGGTGTNTISATFINSGAIQATTGSLLFTGGEFDQDAGTLQLTPAISFGPNRPFYLNGGTVTGTGTLGGSDINNSVYVEAGGVLAPGNPFGVLTVPGGSGIVINNGASFNVVLGGASQFSQLAVSNAIIINGTLTLNVTLTNGYVPPIGTQFQIISSPGTYGSFSTLNVPAGMAVTYSNTSGVYLTVTGSTPVQLQSPKISGGNFVFGFGTTNGLGYTVQQNSDLSTTNWTYYTNLIGNGSLYQVVAPGTNVTQLFFRVRQP
jgi:fibronectin-binding autotransporter adhesin